MLAVGVVVAGCGGGSTSADGPVVPGPGDITSGATMDACQYLTQSDAETMLGAATGPGQLKHVNDQDAVCDYAPKNSPKIGQGVVLTVYKGDFVGQELDNFKQQYKDAQPVDGLGFKALRSTAYAAFGAQGDKRSCELLLTGKKPADQDAFAKQAAAACARALKG